MSAIQICFPSCWNNKRGCPRQVAMPPTTLLNNTKHHQHWITMIGPGKRVKSLSCAHCPVTSSSINFEPDMVPLWFKVLRAALSALYPTPILAATYDTCLSSFGPGVCGSRLILAHYISTTRQSGAQIKVAADAKSIVLLICIICQRMNLTASCGKNHGMSWTHFHDSSLCKISYEWRGAVHLLQNSKWCAIASYIHLHNCPNVENQHLKHVHRVQL